MKRIPVDVRERMVGLSLVVPVGPEVVRYTITPKTTTIRFSLRTSEPAEVKARQADAAAYFERLWFSLRRSKPFSLTHRQCVAISGDIFRAWIGESGRSLVADLSSDRTTWTVYEEPVTPPEGWQAALDALPSIEDEPETGKLECLFGTIIDHGLRERGISEVDEPSRILLLREFLRALRDAFAVRKRQASGDYTPAPEQNRFPAWEPAAEKKYTESPKAAAPKVSIRGLPERWWAEAKQANRSQSTYESYTRSLHSLAAFLAHDAAQDVTNADVVRFKDARIAAGASLKTVRDSDLAALRSVFGWATDNGLLSTNPALGVKVIKPKRVQTRENGFTPEEAHAILSKSLAHRGASNEKPQTTAAKRWIPWLCAYTGARVGELVQLRKEDVRSQMRKGGGDELWIITITPEAGTVKDKEVREVVLHPHLVEMGFPQFVGSSKAGPLFLTVKPGEDIRGQWRGIKNRLAEFAREVVPDPRVKPSHGWRHLFQTKGHEAGIADSVLDAIGGWAPSSVARGYGDVTLEAQAAAFAKFPRFEIDSKADGES